MSNNVDTLDIINRIREFKDKKQLILNHAIYLEHDIVNHQPIQLIYFDLVTLYKDWNHCNNTALMSSTSNFIQDVAFSYGLFSSIMLFNKSYLDTPAKQNKIAKALTRDIHDFRNCHDDTDARELKNIKPKLKSKHIHHVSHSSNNTKIEFVNNLPKSTLDKFVKLSNNIDYDNSLESLSKAKEIAPKVVAQAQKAYSFSDDYLANPYHATFFINLMVGDITHFHGFIK